MRQSKKIRLGFGNSVFMVIVTLIATLVCLAIIYPLWYMICVTISDGNAVLRGEVTLWPKGFSLNAIQTILQNPLVPRAYLNTVIYTVSGTIINVFMTALCAYPLSRKEFFGRKVFNALIVFTMFFSAGMIPGYLVVNSLHMRNTIFALIIPGAISTWNMLVMRTFFRDLPEEMYESARLDGANDPVIFTKIVLPCSKAVLATMVLFYAVGHWNAYIGPLIYLDERNKLPMQLVLRNIVIGADNAMLQGSSSVMSDTAMNSINVKYAAVFVTVLPVLVVYPFVQKHFVKGVLIGSVKG